MKSVLIIGYGSIGRRHSEILTALYPGCRIDLVSSHLENAPGMYKALSEVPGLGSYDYFIIATKTAHHRRDLVLLDAAVFGKIILVEKPIFDDCRPYTSVSNRVFVGYNLRYHPLIAKLKTLSYTRKVLSVSVRVGQYLPDWRSGMDYTESYSAHKSQGGGVLLDLSHEIDYVQWIYGKICDLRAINSKISDLKIDSDDYASIIGMTEKGVMVSMTMDYLSREPGRTIIVQYECSTIFVDLIKNEIREVGGEVKRTDAPATPVERNYTYAAMHQDILSGSSDSACTLAEGIKVMETIAMVRKQAKEDWIG